MFGLGFFEIILLGISIIILINPNDYPKIIRGLGKLVRKYKQLHHILQNELQEISDIDNITKKK